MRSEVPAAGADSGRSAVFPLSMELDVVAGMLNFELPDHPVYDAGELVWWPKPVSPMSMAAL